MSAIHDDPNQLLETLSAYLDAALDEQDQAEMEAHLQSCVSCGQELANLRQIREMLRALPTARPPRSFMLPETAGASSRRATHHRGRWARIAQISGGIAAAVGLAFLIAGTLPGATSNTSSAGVYAPESQHNNTITGSPQMGATTARTAPVASATTTTGETERQPPAGRMGNPSNGTGLPLLPTTGVALLIGGAGALATGTVARRRASGGATR